MSWSTRERVKRLRRINPCLTLQSIGDACGISRERVRQILNSENMETKGVVFKRLCLNCEGFLKSGNRKFCSPKCRYEYNYPLVECMQCHKLFRKWQGYLKRYSHHFCSRSCKGKWVINRYGTKLKGGARKYDYSLILKLKGEGLKYKDIGERIGTNKYVVQQIIYKINHNLVEMNESREGY